MPSTFNPQWLLTCALLLILVIAKAWHIQINMCNFWRWTLLYNNHLIDIQVGTCTNSIFLWVAGYFFTVWVYCSWIIHPTIECYLGCCQFEAFTNEAAMDFFGGVSVLVLPHGSWVRHLELGLQAFCDWAISCLTFWGIPQIAFQRCSPFYIPARNVVSFSASSTVLGGRKTDWQKWIYTKEVF